MNKEIQIFSNDQFGQIRTVEEGDKIYFVASDVAKALGYKKPQNAVATHCKGALKRGILTNGGKQELNVIPEGDVYRLVTHSELPSAQKFESWVFDEVLPTIRKHGAYATPDTLDKMIASPEFGIKLLTALKEEQEKNGKLTEELDAAQPSIVFAKAVSASDTSILIGGLAKLIKQNGINIGQKRLFQWMRDNGYLIKAGNDKNIPTQRSMEMGLFEVKEGSYVDGDGVNRTTRTTKVTGKGQIYFINKFMENNPVMHKEEAHA